MPNEISCLKVGRFFLSPTTQAVLFMEATILTINVGSTSIKTRLFAANLAVLALHTLDYSDHQALHQEGSDLTQQAFNNTVAGHFLPQDALALVLQSWQHWLHEANINLTAIGHRVVHGASWFDGVTLIDAKTLERLADLDAYAPLHNPFNRLGISLAMASFPALKQFAVFDTAFHRTIPDYAGRYGLPEGLSEHLDFYRYGFHGISCQHSVEASAALLNKSADDINLIILHLGGGASVTAIAQGKSIDTSMGFSPTEGVMMSSRCGDLDPMILISLQKAGHSPEQLEALINKHSGLKGVCGESDMRVILQQVTQQEPAALLALAMFCYRLKKYIGAYWAVLGEVTALVFTGGIGEHAALVRSNIVAGLEGFGVILDACANQQPETRGNRDISQANSRTKILIIQAEEERVCAKQILTYLDDESFHNSTGE